MWPPSDVVNEHKRRVSFICVSFLGLIIGYSVWLVVSTIEKRKNPTVSLRLKEDRYKFPTISICAFFEESGVGNGCDSEYLDCAKNMATWAINLVGFENNDGTSSIAKLNGEFEDYCIDLDLSSINETEVETSTYYPPRIVFDTRWYPSGFEDIAVGDQVNERSESVAVFFTDPEISNPLGNHNKSNFVGSIPFTRQSAGKKTTTFFATEIAMALTESVTLDEGNTKTYSAGTISSIFYEIPNGLINEAPRTVDRVFMFMRVSQPALTHTISTEVDPLEWAELFGSIGGTWGE